MGNILAHQSWVPTPFYRAMSLSQKLGMDLWLKREDCTPVGSFKLRGALLAVEKHKALLKERGLCVASAGNYGLAMAFAVSVWKYDNVVFVPENVTESKESSIRTTGAYVIKKGRDFDESKQYAKSYAQEIGMIYWEDGVLPEMALGSGTIAQEIINVSSSWDTILVPLGNGSLIKGIALEMRKILPKIRIIGLVPSGSPSMWEAFHEGQGTAGAETQTIADGLSVRIPIQKITDEIKGLVDDVWLVPEKMLVPAVRTFLDTERILVEPSAAITLAGIVDNISRLSAEKIATIVTGCHVQTKVLQDALLESSLL